MKTITEYSSIMEVVETFHDETQNHVYLEQTRWPEGIYCPHCLNDKIYRFKDLKRFKCKTCKAHFNAKTGTIYEGTKLPLKKWFIAKYLDVLSKKGISSYELAKQIKVTQPTAWFMLTRLRSVMVNAESRKGKLQGTIEMDETWIGGKMKNIHKKRKEKYESWKDNKTIVFGMLQRDGELKCAIVPDRNAYNLRVEMVSGVEGNSTIVTDEHLGYVSTWMYYKKHKTVNHAARVYSEGDVSTNGIENFWSILKRGINGVHHHVSKKHVNKYVQEFVFRYNTRNLSTKEKMEILIRNSDVRLKLKDLKKRKAA
jgi:transposase-like protein